MLKRWRLGIFKNSYQNETAHCPEKIWYIKYNILRILQQNVIFFNKTRSLYFYENYEGLIGHSGENSGISVKKSDKFINAVVLQEKNGNPWLKYLYIWSICIYDIKNRYLSFGKNRKINDYSANHQIVTILYLYKKP